MQEVFESRIGKRPAATGEYVVLLPVIAPDEARSLLAQVDLQQRIHRNQSLHSLSKMAFAIIQAIIHRLEQRHRVELLEPVNQSMKLIRYAADEGFHLEVREIREHERPPMATIPEYRQARGMAPHRLMADSTCHNH